MNYLSTLEEGDDRDWRRERLAEHRDRVAEQLRDAEDPRVRDKLRWLAEYHNYYCLEHVGKADELLVPADLTGRESRCSAIT